jgi:hypothetical protein
MYQQSTQNGAGPEDRSGDGGGAAPEDDVVEGEFRQV